MCSLFFFFFSSRRRHTRWTGDWSSDVCSSDLPLPGNRTGILARIHHCLADGIAGVGLMNVIMDSTPVRHRLPRKPRPFQRSEEHTSELQSPVHLVCRLLLEKKKMYMFLSR